ncbi:hypothetical protein V6N11_043271 [Hibiscus sabdariffa]|uniref:Uncharacterized protein n=1 Tax=Hibiscus sabdariffa TaxID=183260 RepID=A0ABR2QYS7_9ROSI
MPAVFAANVAGKVLGKLGSSAFQEICLMWGVQDEFHKLKQVLIAIKAVLVDAEEQQARNQELTLWLEKIKNACYEVEDLLDEFEIEALRRQVLELGNTGRKVRNLFSTSNPLSFRFRMGWKIRKTNKMLDDIAASKSKFRLHETHEVKSVLHRERETYSFVKASDVIGRDEDKENIIKFLMNPTDGEDIPVLPIVGIGGIGKTALAQLVFHDERVQMHFDLNIWVCVTEDFDVKQLMIKIIKSATGMKCKDMNKEELHKVLQNCLNGNRCLIVLDDVWNEDNKKWIELKDLLASGDEGSKIIVTTRSSNVAIITGSTPQYDLKNLSHGNSLSLFLKLALRNGEDKQYKNLVRIGGEIVPKCKGVALALKTLGSMLRSTRVERNWELVRDNEIWELEHKENDILPALKLSYDQLPWNVRHLWLDLSGQTASKLPNNLGHLRTLMVTSEERKANTEFLIPTCISKSKHLRVLDFVESSFEQLPNNIRNLKHLRYLSIAGNENIKKIPNFIWNLQSLQALNLGLCKGIEELPKDIRYLISLRTLLVTTRQTDLQENGIGCLSCLRMLGFFGCENLKHLFQDMQRLTALRTLVIDECNSLVSLPQGLKHLTSLETLAIASCEKLDLCMGPEVEGMEDGKLRKLLIQGLPKMESLPQWVLLGSTKTLQELYILELKNLLALPSWFQHLVSLQRLVIRNCPKLPYLPEGMQHLTALKQLEIIGCPALSQRCMEGTGEDWSKIAHVPCLYLNDLETSTTDGE